jgi:hypothetical protein
MLKAEELMQSPSSIGSEKHKKDKLKEQGSDFSFILNRVPSPMNNNFLLSAE